MPRRNRILLGLVTAALLVGPFAGSTLAIGTLDQSQTTLEGSLFSHWLGQTFTAGRSGALDTVSLYPTTDISGLTIEIRTASGGLPTATTLASEVIPASATNTWVDIAFTSPATVTAGTGYAIILNAHPDGATVLQGFGHYAAGMGLFGVALSAFGQSPPANQRRQGEALQDQGREDDAEGEEEDECPSRKRRSGGDGDRDRQCEDQRVPTSHPGPAEEGNLAPLGISSPAPRPSPGPPQHRAGEEGVDQAHPDDGLALILHAVDRFQVFLDRRAHLGRGGADFGVV